MTIALPRSILLITAALIGFAAQSQSTVRVATEVTCTFGVRVLFSDGTCSDPEEPMYSWCQTLVGPGYQDFNVPNDAQYFSL